MKTYGGVEPFLTSALAGGEWSTSRSGLFILGERSPDIQIKYSSWTIRKEQEYVGRYTD
jgi:hypothetical protein